MPFLIFFGVLMYLVIDSDHKPEQQYVQIQYVVQPAPVQNAQ